MCIHFSFFPPPYLHRQVTTAHTHSMFFWGFWLFFLCFPPSCPISLQTSYFAWFYLFSTSCACDEMWLALWDVSVLSFCCAGKAGYQSKLWTTWWLVATFRGHASLACDPSWLVCLPAALTHMSHLNWTPNKELSHTWTVSRTHAS